MIRRLLWILTLLGIAALVRSITRHARVVEAPAPAAGPRFEGAMVQDRVCRTFLPRSRALVLRLQDQEHFFCSEGCRTTFLERQRNAR